MKPRLITPKTGLVDPLGDPTPEQKSLIRYEPAPWTGKNESGHMPCGDRVLVLPDRVRPQSEGGVALPAEIIDRMTLAAESGVVVALGDGAFTWNSDRISTYKGRKPKPGDRVYIERYSGQIVLGHDGRFYRLLDDRAVGAIVIDDDQQQGDAG